MNAASTFCTSLFDRLQKRNLLIGRLNIPGGASPREHYGGPRLMPTHNQTACNPAREDQRAIWQQRQTQTSSSLQVSQRMEVKNHLETADMGFLCVSQAV